MRRIWYDLPPEVRAYFQAQADEGVRLTFNYVRSYLNDIGFRDAARLGYGYGGPDSAMVLSSGPPSGPPTPRKRPADQQVSTHVIKKKNIGTSSMKQIAGQARVGGEIISVSDGNGIIHTKSTIKYPRPPKISRYDKTNCTHGTFEDRVYKRTSSGVAQQNVMILGLDQTNQTFIDNITSQINPAPGGEANREGGLQLMYSLVWQKQTWNITNASVFACHYDIYDYKANSDMNDNNNPWKLIQDSISQYGTGRNSSGVPENRYQYDDRSFSDFAWIDTFMSAKQFQILNDHWKLCKRKRVYLQPGQTLVHTHWRRPNYLHHKPDDNDDGIKYRKHFASFVLVLAQGQTAHTSDTPGPGNTHQATIAGNIDDVVGSVVTYVRQHQPFCNYFFQLRGPSAPNAGQQRDKAEEITDAAMQDTVGNIE